MSTQFMYSPKPLSIVWENVPYNLTIGGWNLKDTDWYGHANLSNKTTRQFLLISGNNGYIVIDEISTGMWRMERQYSSLDEARTACGNGSYQLPKLV